MRDMRDIPTELSIPAQSHQSLPMKLLSLQKTTGNHIPGRILSYARSPYSRPEEEKDRSAAHR